MNSLNNLLIQWDDIGLKVRPSHSAYNSCISRYFEALDGIDIAPPHLREYYIVSKRKWARLSRLLDEILTHQDWNNS
jgi:hypothetical protein